MGFINWSVLVAFSKEKATTYYILSWQFLKFSMEFVEVLSPAHASTVLLISKSYKPQPQKKEPELNNCMT